MPGGTTTNQNQTSGQTENQNVSGQTNPWAPSQGLLNSIIGQLGGQSAAVTPQQQSAANTLYDATTGLPNFSGSAGNLADKLFGYSTDPEQSILTNANNTYSKELSPYLTTSYLNPYNTPGFSDALKTMNTDISNQVNDEFAAAGRDLSPGNTTALARGLSQGEGGLLSEQFNRNVGTQLGAAGSQFGANTSTASGLTAQQQAEQAAREAGIGVAGAVPGLAMAPGMAQWQAANMGAQLPFQNLGWLEQSALPLAGVGSTTTGNTSGTAFGNQAGTTTKQTDPFSNILGGVLGGAGLIGGTGGFGSNGWLKGLFSQ